MGGLRSFDGHQDVQTHVMSAIQTTKDDSSVNTIAEDSRRYDYSSRQLLDRDEYIAGRQKELINWNRFDVSREARLLTALTKA